MSSKRILLPILVVWNLFTNGSSLLSAPLEEEDEEFRPGLVAEYRGGERAVTRIDPDVAFAWDEAAPDARVSAERFEGTWRGFLLVRQEAKHRLHAFVQGDVSVELDGQRVLQGSAKQPQWISGDEFVPNFGERPLVVTFRKTEATAQLKLFWSSDVFGLEPIPAELLFHEQTPAEVALIESGRQQFAAFRCGRCHVRDGDSLAPAAPSLQHVAAAMTAEQIAKRLAPAINSPDATALDRRMPHFRLNEEQARHLAAFLVKQSESVKLDEAKTIKPKTPKEGEVVVAPQRRGELLLRSVGCLACHRIGELGNSNDLPFAGPDLTHVGQRRSAAWLTTWLADPQRLNDDHRMPVFSLTDEERHLIVMALVENSPVRTQRTEGTKGSQKDAATEPSNAASAETGRRLFVDLRCAACHRTTEKKLTEFARAKSDLSQPITEWSKSCLAEGQELRGEGDNKETPTATQYSVLSAQPRYSGLDDAAIKAFLASRWDRPLSRESQFVRGTRMLEEKNCFACHPRHGGLGLGLTAKLVASSDKDLNGQAPALVAPSLNAIGDKLLDEALSIAVRGERQPIRMPWLKVRMPRFKHSPEELATLTRYFVEHDRIPAMPSAQANGGRQPPGASEPARTPTSGLTPTVHQEAADAHTLLAGQALTGVRGWSCIACHKIGDYEPKQVALGARGSDLKRLGKHLRPEFFFRWIASPLRVIPGVEMPQYNRPVAGVLDGDLSKQHAALWQALNDPNFQPPTNPANVEQLWVVNPGERPRIIRDVFQVPKHLGGGNIARGFAVGVNSGHSLLFDAETMSVRQWTFGDFARQQTSGKRWFWEMAGSEVLAELPPIQFAIRSRKPPHNVFLASSTDQGLIGEVEVTTLGVKLRHRVICRSGKDQTREGIIAGFGIEEMIEPIVDREAQPMRTGIQRTLHIDGPWDGRGPRIDEFDFWFGRPASFVGKHSPRIEATDAEWQRLIPDDQPGGKLEWTPLRYSTVTLSYSAAMTRLDLPTPARPAVRPVEQLRISSVPGFDGVQLPLDASIMPTGFDWRSNGQLVFTSLKGHVFAADDQNHDGVEDRLELLHEGLCGPYGILVPKNPFGFQQPSPNYVLVATKSALFTLRDSDGDGYLNQQSTDFLNWGFTDDYHEWASGPVSDSKGNLFVGLASDYTDKNRPKDRSLWRGKVLKREPQQAQGRLSVLHPIGHAFRYPTGIAINERDEVFVSDQQGVQNCFNEINYLVEGAHYGVPSTHEEDKDAPETKAAIQIPHPWTRSVNGLCFLTGNEGYPDLKGHGIGCEYNGRFLIRFTTQRVGDVMQGAVYPFSITDEEMVRRTGGVSPLVGAKPSDGTRGLTSPVRQANFEGPLCCGVSPKGEIYIGSISDSGWAGGQNTGSIVKLKGNGKRPNGIREIRATRDGFDIEFFAPVDRARATNPEHYSISGYTRVWGGAYTTPDSDRHRCKVLAVELSADGKTAKLKVDLRKTPNYVYDISCREVAGPDKPLWPDYGFFTLHKIP